MAEESVAVAGVEWEEEVHPVIINYDVLENIFSFLNPSDLKEARLICKVWGMVGKMELESRTFLEINKLDFGNLEEGEIPAIPPRLTRRIKINLEIGLTEDSPMAVEHFLPFLRFHRSNIEELLFEGEDYFLHPIKTVLEAIVFPNLKKISLHELDQDEEEDPVPEEFQMPRLSMGLYSVKSLQFWPSEYEHMALSNTTSTSTNERNFPLFQEIINKCPNLEELKVFRQFYPDLSNCVNLKSLEWVGPTSEMLSDYGWSKIVYHGRDFSVPKMIGMLTPIKDRLENLSLGSPIDQEADEIDLSSLGDSSIPSRFAQRGGNLSWRDPVEYPSMPKLIQLFVSDVNVFGPSYNSFIQNRFPALKSLVLRSTHKYEFPIKKLLADCTHVNNDEVKLESLSLNQFPLDILYAWEVISPTFPNLKELSLGFTTERGTRDLTARIVSNPWRLKNSLTILSRNLVNLEKLTIEIKFRCTFYGLMEAIYVNGFKHNNLDSKKLSLKLVAPDPGLITDDGSTPKIWEANVIYKSLIFQGFRVREETRKKVQDFVVEWDVKNVYFLQ